MNPNVYANSVQKDLTLIETEAVIIVGVNLGNDEIFYYEMTELKSLCEACNYEVMETVTQNLLKANPKTFVGSGKIEEIKEIALGLDIKKIIFNDELTPAQIKNISDALGDDFEVEDRTMLILEIFDKRSTTKEAKLQVEVARLKYMLPRLIGTRSYMSRTTGSASGGAATRGLGETKLELDRRHIEMKIAKKKSELDEIKASRATARKARLNSDIKQIAFVGYTNAGKSSTINALLKMYGTSEEEKEVFVKDMLFATLETQTRKIKLSNNHQFLITDTVGFVSKLPHHLVESFKSTLEEINEADLIIHIVDANSPFRELQIKTTNEVLSSLGCDKIPTLLVLNKCDLVKNMITLSAYSDSLHLSAKLKQGLRELVEKIDTTLYDKQYLDTFLIPFSEGRLVNLLNEKATIKETTYLNNGTKITAVVDFKLHQMLEKYILKEDA